MSSDKQTTIGEGPELASNHPLTKHRLNHLCRVLSKVLWKKRGLKCKLSSTSNGELQFSGAYQGLKCLQIFSRQLTNDDPMEWLDAPDQVLVPGPWKEVCILSATDDAPYWLREEVSDVIRVFQRFFIKARGALIGPYTVYKSRPQNYD